MIRIAPDTNSPTLLPRTLEMDFHHLRRVDVDTANEAVETVVGEQFRFSVRARAIPFCNLGLKEKPPYRQSYRPRFNL